MPAKRKTTNKMKVDSSNREMRLYLKEISKIPILSASEEKELGKRAQAGEQEAIQILVQSNLRFVIMVAKRYQGCGLPMMDLINEGNLGLITAAERFDPTRNVKFTSYAIWWIRQAITHALSNMVHPLRLPPKVSMALYRIKKTVNKKTDELKRNPTRLEICNELGMSENELSNILELGAGGVSLSQPVDDSGELLVGEQLEQTSQRPADETIALTFLGEHMNQALDELSPAEKNVLRLRFGLDDDTPRTLSDIGQRMGLSRERIRQVEAKALQKLRHVDQAKSLATYLV
jgi:RNA polymerase primary sigma factor